MTSFTVSDMTCGGCVKAITAALKQVAPDATVATDLATHRVDVTTAASADILAEAMRDAGFTPEAIAA
jgi:copper chaperone